MNLNIEQFEEIMNNPYIKEQMNHIVRQSLFDTNTSVSNSVWVDMENILNNAAYDNHMSNINIPDDILDICKSKLNDNTLTNNISLKNLDKAFLHKSIKQESLGTIFTNRQL